MLAIVLSLLAIIILAPAALFIGMVALATIVALIGRH